jgi:hypothetical protein
MVECSTVVRFWLDVSIESIGQINQGSKNEI